MPEMIRKLMSVEVKEVGDRTLEIAGSTEDKDRMGDIIRSNGWKLKEFKKNPVFMWAHDYNKPPIGRATRVWVDKETNKLMFKVEFASPEVYEFADTIFKLYKGGFLHATSVGFIPLDWEGKDEENPNPKWEGNVFTSQELLELSAVPVPANANALVTARDQGLITVKEFEAVSQFTQEIIEVPSKDGKWKEFEIVTRPEETEDYIRIPNPKDDKKPHKGHAIRHIDIDKGKGIKALYCIDDKVIVTYLFSKDEGWTMASAQEWVDKHSKAVENIIVSTLSESVEQQYLSYESNYVEKMEEPPEPKAISQAELGDELDFTIKAIKEVGLNDEQMPIALKLASAIIERVPGSDIPVDILSKVGAVLNTKNEERLLEIEQRIQEILDSTRTIEEEGEKQVEPLDLQLDPMATAKQRAQEVAEVANLVIAKLKGKRIR